MNKQDFVIEMPAVEADLKKTNVERYTSAFIKKREELFLMVVERCLGRKPKRKDFLDFSIKIDILSGGYEIFYLKNKVGRIEVTVKNLESSAQLIATFIPSPPAYVA